MQVIPIKLRLPWGKGIHGNTYDQELETKVRERSWPAGPCAGLRNILSAGGSGSEPAHPGNWKPRPDCPTLFSFSVDDFSFHQDRKSNK